MKAYGYVKGSDKIIELKEVNLVCSLEEIQKLIPFIKMVSERHKYFSDSDETIHTHYREWDKEWDDTNDELTDIIITTKPER